MKILVTGASGKLGSYLLREAAGRDLVGCSRSTPAQTFGCPVERFDLADLSRLDSIQPDVVLHTAALSAIADCLKDPLEADRVNHQITRSLVDWCDQRERRLIYVSTDMVFDGESAPYAEDSPPKPLSVYGRSKWQGEQAVLSGGLDHLVARVALMVGPALGAGRAYYDQLVENLRAGQSVSLFQDEWRAMISYQDAARCLLDLCTHPLGGIVHLAGPRLSRLELGQQIAAQLGVSQLIRAGWRADYPAPEPRPRDLTLIDTRLSDHLPNDQKPRSVASQLGAWLT